jgi:predicted transcriptional regulator
MDLRSLRFQEFDGDRLTIRIADVERKRLRALAACLEVTESELVREALAAWVSVVDEEVLGNRPAA